MKALRIFLRTLILSALVLLVSCSSSSNDDEMKQEPITEPTEPIVPYIPTEAEITEEISDDQLLDIIQRQTLKYFTEYAEPKSGMARERNTSGDMVTTGGTGFGIMAILVGAEREWITREIALTQILKIANFLKNTERFHGAWSHWIKANTNKAFSFSQYDDGGDLIETAFLVQGLITAREYFDKETSQENELRILIDELCDAVEWNWYTKEGTENVLYWHWSKNYSWKMNMKITGWNEGLIAYVLAASSKNYSISKEVYDKGWARNGEMKNGKTYYDVKLPLGAPYGGPLFFSHYSFLGLDPRGLSDQYANYWEQNKAHSLINYKYCVVNPKNFVGYSENFWGLTASDEKDGYSAHAPWNQWGKDNGTITPTAALSSMPYTPEQSKKAARYFYTYLNSKLWGAYGFKDAINPGLRWTANSYLAIDQGPIVVMIENYRTGLLWKYFMKNKDIQNGLKKLGFTIKN